MSDGAGPEGPMDEVERAVRSVEDPNVTFVGGFDLAESPIDITDEVRRSCERNYCGYYGRSWSCPPHVPPCQTCRIMLAGYPRMMLVRTTFKRDGPFDLEGMRASSLAHARYSFRVRDRLEGIEGLRFKVLGAGSCAYCERCTCPDEPCRFPDRRMNSLESYGIDLTSFLMAHGIAGRGGNDEQSYFSMVLYVPPRVRGRAVYLRCRHPTDVYRYAALEDSIVRSVRELSEGRDVAVAFSGGLDSGLVAALASRYAGSVRLYTCGTSNAYDVAAARELSGRLGLPWVHVRLTTGNIGPLLTELMSSTRITDPFTASYELQLFSVCKEADEETVLTGQGADEYFMGCAKYVGRTPEAYEALVRAGKERLLEVSVPCERAIAAYFGKDLGYPYLDPGVIAEVDRLDPADLVPRDMDSRKAVLRDVALHLGFDSLGDRRKKSSQYGSGTTDLIRAVARERGMRYNEYIDSLRGDATSGLPMSGRGSVVDARVDSVLKAEAERIIREGGMDPSSVVDAVYRRIVRDGDLRSIRDDERARSLITMSFLLPYAILIVETTIFNYRTIIRPSMVSNDSDGHGRYGNVETEYKPVSRGIPESLWSTYSALANTEGGRIVLGAMLIEGDLIVTGIDDPEMMVREIRSRVRDPGRASVDLISDSLAVDGIDGRSVVVIDVLRADRRVRPVYVNGRREGGTFRRMDGADRMCTMDEIDSMVRDSGPPIDGTVLSWAGTGDLDRDTVLEYRAEMRSADPESPLNRLGMDDFLRAIGAVGSEDGREGLTVAGLLMFGHNHRILRWNGAFSLDYYEPMGDGPDWRYRLSTRDTTWVGNVYNFHRMVLQKLSEPAFGGCLQGGLRAAVGEAVMNALMNEDYAGPEGVRIVRRPETLEISNYGDLRIPLREAVTGGRSDPRNPTVARMFQLIGRAELSGSGMRSIASVWEGCGLGRPELDIVHGPSRVILRLGLTPASHQDETSPRA